MFGLNTEEVRKVCEAWYKQKGLDIANKLKDEIVTDNLLTFSENKSKIDGLIKKAEILSEAIQNAIELARTEVSLATQKLTQEHKESVQASKEAVELSRAAATNADLNSSKIKTIMGMCERIISSVEHGEKARAAVMSRTAEVVQANNETLMSTLSRLDAHLEKWVRIQEESSYADMQKVAAIKELTKVFASTVIVEEEEPAPVAKRSKKKK